MTRTYVINAELVSVHDHYLYNANDRRVSYFDEEISKKHCEMCESCTKTNSACTNCVSDECFYCDNYICNSCDNYRNDGWVDCAIYTDETGRDYFMYKGIKVFYDAWMRLSYSDFQKKLSTSKITESDFMTMLYTEGISNVTFNIPMHNRCYFIDTTDKCVVTTCKIDESRYPLHETYKIGMRTIEESDTVRNYDDWYLSDFISMIQRGDVSINKIA